MHSTITPGDLEGVDLAAELVAMLVAEAVFTANARALGATLRTEGRVLDLLA